ncbi:MAG: hypothetical protein RLY47_406 [Candidatus Parcubacteria bacterium]|jgi:hypothetical protein
MNIAAHLRTRCFYNFDRNVYYKNYRAYEERTQYKKDICVDKFCNEKLF